jgi:hypothetical protein
MGIHQSKVPPFWNYFLAIEDDLAKLSRWVEFHKANQNCYSLEIARLLMAAAQEVDVVAKELCGELDPKAKAGKIGPYKTVLLKSYPGLPRSKVQIPKHGLTLRPWSDWSTGESPPLWWTANNKVKHERAQHFHQATLKNVLNACSGLFILLLLHYAQKRPSIYPASSLFEPRSYAYRDGTSLVFNEKAKGS